MKPQQPSLPISNDQYSNIVQGLPVTNMDNYSALNTQQNQKQVNQQDNFLHTLPIQQSVQVPVKQQLPDPNVPHETNHHYFTMSLWGYSAVHFFLFLAIIFIQRFLYGYQATYTLYCARQIKIDHSYFSLLFSNIIAHCGSGRIRLKRFNWSLGLLALFIILQIASFVYAVMYPIRYSFTNSDVNDAMNDYQVYYQGQVNEENARNDYDDRRRILIQEYYDMKDICNILRDAYGAQFQAKSYAQYCFDVLNGKSDDSSPNRLAPLQIGLLLYYIVALLAALILTYILGRRLQNYIAYMRTIVKVTVIQTGQQVYVKSKSKSSTIRKR